MDQHQVTSKFGASVRSAAAASLLLVGLGGCENFRSDFKEAFMPRSEILTSIQADLYRAMLMSDTIEHLRVTPPKGYHIKSKAGAKKSTLAHTVVKPLLKPEIGPSKDAIRIPKIITQKPVYLTVSEVRDVNLEYQGGAEAFFRQMADRLGYKVEVSGTSSDIPLNINASQEPLFGVVIRAANTVKEQMRVRFDMEANVIHIDYANTKGSN